MKRSATIVGMLVLSFPLSSNGKPCCFHPSATLASGRRHDVGHRPYRLDERLERRYFRYLPSTYSIRSQANSLSSTVCHMGNKNKIPTFFDRKEKQDDESNEDGQSNNKRGPFKRVREKISSAFNKKGDDNKTEEGDEAGYKPNPIDALRLRLAMAMSNINIFQQKEEWVVACPKTRVGPGQIIPCTVQGLDIIIFASRDGQRLDAFANACPHLGSPFDLATIERKPALNDKGRTDDGAGNGCVDCIVCPVHRTAFEIESGQVRGEWCPYPPVIGGIM